MIVLNGMTVWNQQEKIGIGGGGGGGGGGGEKNEPWKPSVLPNYTVVRNYERSHATEATKQCLNP